MMLHLTTPFLYLNSGDKSVLSGVHAHQYTYSHTSFVSQRQSNQCFGFCFLHACYFFLARRAAFPTWIKVPKLPPQEARRRCDQSLRVQIQGRRPHCLCETDSNQDSDVSELAEGQFSKK